ncbi:hypothetical protein DZS_28270 [Dickeya ananatis]
MKKRIDYLKNFGFADETTVVAPGINGKMNEVQAAFGLLQLKYIEQALEDRKRIYHYYRDGLARIHGLTTVSVPDSIDWNYAYFPLFMNDCSFDTREKLYSALKSAGHYVSPVFLSVN